MARMRISQLAQATGGAPVGDDVEFLRVTTDSRKLQAGDLFVALRGPNFDGHRFAGSAGEQGAVAALVSEPLAGDLPHVRVSDTRAALGSLASWWRSRFDLPVVGITGSNGKTTCKEMVAAILRQRGPVLATRGNLNNDIGLPLTLLDLNESHAYAVIEMGANHPGEIAYLTHIAKPDVALLNNAGRAHLEGFGSLEGVARAKGEIFSGLSADGIAVLNRDDRFYPLWREVIGSRPYVDFGIHPEALVRAATDQVPLLRDDLGLSQQFTIHGVGADRPVNLRLAGAHNLRNALAASAVAKALEIPAADIVDGLESMRPVAGRLNPRLAPNGALVIDDTYNANPDSLDAALASLSALHGPRWLVLGDMGELGPEAAELHRAMGEAARAAGLQRLFATGPLSRHAVGSFGAGARHFPDTDALSAAINAGLRADTIVLVKGSRAQRMERVVASLCGGGEG
ncbi:MAG: UDP-N-acetylmuramoyl-tripeptide--D-alanyl-D-alanine ligase [Chromatiales bacterium]|nr:UDP-N-acetylmuramoyl-tripeptide--D-alanyl-D-alanine ligase [Chromatiales bacterium]